MAKKIQSNKEAGPAKPIKPAKPKKPAAAATSKDPPQSDTPQRNPDGTFAKGHTKTGGSQQGTKQQRSLRVQNAVLLMVQDEVESSRFTKGLQNLYMEDPKGYYQVLAALMKFCAPTLQSQSLEIQDTQLTRTIDDRLDQLMNSVNKK